MAVVAGVFFFTALFFVLIGCAWLLYYELPIGNEFTYFWGFFAMAVILVVLGVIAGLLASRAVKSGSPPVPEMAIEEARKIRETVSSSSSSQANAPKANVACCITELHAGHAGAELRGGCSREAADAGRDWARQRSWKGDDRWHNARQLRSADSIESNRAELAVSLNNLHGEVARITDWRGQLERHQRELAIGAAVVGVLLLGRRRRRKRRRG